MNLKLLSTLVTHTVKKQTRKEHCPLDTPVKEKKKKMRENIPDYRANEQGQGT